MLFSPGLLSQADFMFVAGIPRESLDGSDSTVFIGSFVKGEYFLVSACPSLFLLVSPSLPPVVAASNLSSLDYEQVCLRDQDITPQYAATGTGVAILANRISHCFNLTGASQAIDTGCSASLVAIHQACQSLLSGECSTVSHP